MAPILMNKFMEIYTYITALLVVPLMFIVYFSLLKYFKNMDNTEIKKIAHREICGLCHRESPIGFWVPNDVWKAAVHPHYIESIHCINCFVERADAQLLEWDKVIKFYPTSLKTHLQNVIKLRVIEREPKEEDDPCSNCSDFLCRCDTRYL